MLGKEVVFFCKPSVLVVRDLQKEYDRRGIAQNNTLLEQLL